MQVAGSKFHETMLFYRGAAEWNRLPSFLKDCDKNYVFKILLKCHIKDLR